jgi:hypothetical protein
MCRFSSGNWFFCNKFVQLAVAGSRRNTCVHLKKKECNKSDLIAAQYFWLVDHNDWSRWFAISSPHINSVPVTVLLVGYPRKTSKLRHLILLSRVTYWAPVEMLLGGSMCVRWRSFWGSSRSCVSSICLITLWKPFLKSGREINGHETPKKTRSRIEKMNRMPQKQTLDIGLQKKKS